MLQADLSPSELAIAMSVKVVAMNTNCYSFLKDFIASERSRIVGATVLYSTVTVTVINGNLELDGFSSLAL